MKLIYLTLEYTSQKTYIQKVVPCYLIFVVFNQYKAKVLFVLGFCAYYFFSVFFPLLLLRVFACENRLSMYIKISLTRAIFEVVLHLMAKTNLAIIITVYQERSNILNQAPINMKIAHTKLSLHISLLARTH